MPSNSREISSGSQLFGNLCGSYYGFSCYRTVNATMGLHFENKVGGRIVGTSPRQILAVKGIPCASSGFFYWAAL